MDKDYEDNYWPEDAIFMERNSRDFVSRIDRINKNAETICETLRASPIGESILSQPLKLANSNQSRRYIIQSIVGRGRSMMTAATRTEVTVACFR